MLEAPLNPCVYVALPVFNRIEETRKFIDCIRLQTYPNIQVVICDDGSTDGTASYLQNETPEVTVLTGDGNLWWTGGMNRCVEYILTICKDFDYVLTINNDVLIDPDYVAQKVRRALSMPGAVIGSVCVYQDDPDRVETSGMLLNMATCILQPIVPVNSSLFQLKISGCISATNLPAKGVLIPVGVYRAIGLYDGLSFPHYHADSDFTLRAIESGIPVVVDFDSRVLSNVNRGNLISGKDISFSSIKKSFDSLSGVNSFAAYHAFARKHFGYRAWQYLLVSYAKIFAGMLRRLLLEKVFTFRASK